MRLAISAFLCAISFPGVVFAHTLAADDPPFVTTPEAAVLRMLELAAPQEGDTVVDLGSGDGRIVIAAARRYPVLARGYELDETLVRISRINAAKAGLAERVDFVRGDIFDADLRGVQVVTMFLRESLNLRLRQKLCEELVSGARVVTYRYAFGPWAPRHEETMKGERIMLWQVPDDLGCEAD